MAQLVSSIQNTQHIFHGLVEWYIVPRRYLPAAESMAPLTTITPANGTEALVESQDDASYLTGATAMAAATLDLAVTGTQTVGATIGVALHQMDTGSDDADIVFIETDIITADLAADTAADMRTNFGIARAGAGGATNGRVYSKSGAAIADIGTAVTAKYAAASGATNHLILTSAAVNTGNDYDVTWYVRPPAPTVVTLLAEGDPALPGIVKGPYFDGGVELNFAGTQTLINATQSFEPIDDYISASQSTVTITGLLQDRFAWRTLEVASGISAIFSTDSYEGFVPNLLRVQKEFGIFFLIDSQTVTGQKDIVGIYRVAGLGLVKKLDKVHTPIAVSLTPKAVGTRADKLYVATYRPVAA